MQQVSHYIMAPTASEKVADIGFVCEAKVLAIAEVFLFVWGFEGRGCVFWFWGFLFVWCFFFKNTNSDSHHIG